MIWRRAAEARASAFIGGAAEEGVFIALTEQGVQGEVHVVADAQANMLKLGQTLQTEITRAIEEMVGMSVAAIDIYIDDVALPAASAE